MQPHPTTSEVRPGLWRIRLPFHLELNHVNVYLVRLAENGWMMVDTGFGTAGPGEDAPILDPDIMLVPLAAFDRRGHRIGYGAGHYDRAIARLHQKGLQPRLVGVAFDCQEVPLVPNQWHDIMLSDVLTESGLRSFAASPYMSG